MNIAELSCDVRHVQGTGAARALRREGKVPCILYGQGSNISFFVSEREVTRMYDRSGFFSTALKLDIGGEKYIVLPKEVARNPITECVSHIDFMYLTPFSYVNIPIAFDGSPVGVKRGGFLNIIYRKIKLKCDTSMNIPLSIKVSVQDMRIGAVLKAGDLVLPEGVTLAVSTNLILASITGRGKSDDVEKEKGAATKGAATVEAGKAKK